MKKHSDGSARAVLTSNNTPLTMPRKKFRRSQKFDSSNERSFQEYITNQPAPVTSRTEILRLIRGGEDTYLELKVKLSNVERIAQEIVALANTAGGTLVFGVTDQLRVEGLRNPESVQEELARICREEIVPPIIPYLDSISYDNGRRIIVLDVEGRNPPYRTTDGRFYLRIGDEKREASSEELTEWFDEIRPLRFEQIPLQNVFEEDFDDKLLWSFADGFEDERSGANSYDTHKFLKKDLLLAAGKRDEFFPTIAAVLLFGKNEKVAELLPRSIVTAVRYSGNKSEIVEKAEFSGNLLSLYEKTLKFIERYCDLEKSKPKNSNHKKEHEPIQSRGVYHLFSVKEAIANCLIHRDLILRDSPTQISIFDDCIEIKNPRRTKGFAPPASKAIRYGITKKLNPQTAAIFTKREYGANVPKGGLSMILQQSKKFSGKRVEVFTSNDEFKLKIYGF